MTDSLATRAKTAWGVLRGRSDVPGPRLPIRKEAPFLWPAWREGKPQWAITDYKSYVEEGFNLNTLIYSAIMYKVRSVSTAPLRAYSGDPETPTILPKTSPLGKLVYRPNPYQSGQEFMNLNTVYLNIAGNSYVMLDRPRSGALPTAMYPLRPDRVLIVPGDKVLKGYVYVQEGRSPQDGVPILPEDMMHVRLPNPLDPLEGMGYGLSPLAALAQSADVDNAITSYLKIFFQRGAAPNVYLKFDVELDDEVVARARQRFMEMYGGYQNWVGPAVMDNGGEIANFGQNFKDMGFEEIDARNESRVLGPFGVPGVLIGTRLGLNRAINANAIELRRTFWEDTMIPELSWHENEYQYHVEGPSGEFVAFDTSGVPALQLDKAPTVDSFVKLVGVGVPKNVAASFLDMEFGTNLEDGDVPYISSSLVPLSAVSTTPPSTQAPTTPGQASSSTESPSSSSPSTRPGSQQESNFEPDLETKRIEELLERALETAERLMSDHSD